MAGIQLMGMRSIPSVVVIGVGALFFLLYLLPWQHLPSVPFPSPSSLQRNRVNTSMSLESSYPYSLERHRYLGGDIDPLLLSWGSEEPSNPSPQIPHGLVTYRAMVKSGVLFNATGSDVLVILHIQKTGGTSFEKHIVQDLVIEKPCVCWKKRKRCKCPRPSLGL